MAYQISRIYAPVAFYTGSVHEGKQFIIRGKVAYGQERFHINLQEEADENCDVALHFNPRQGDQVVVRNSMQGGSWEEEERDQPHFPFQEGRTFQIRIEVAAGEFRIYVNGRPYVDFGHRMDFTRIRYIFLSDGAEYYDLTFQDRHGLPYSAEIHGGMKEGKAVRIRGACTDSDGFSINFACDPNCDDCTFHFNPRPNEGEVVRNAHFGGWGDEEREQEHFPFNPGQFFDMVIVATAVGYVVYVNEQLYTTFNHRSPVEEARYLYIKGDVSLQDVQQYEPLDDDFVKPVPSGLEKGDTILFRGYFQPEGERFSVNLMEGYDADSDVAFHYNPRRGEGQVVMNNCKGGDWQEEERGDIPQAFMDLLPFEVKIVTKSNKFKVYVNGKKTNTFHARGSVEDIKGINVRGQAHIYQVKLVRKLEKPFYERIPGGLREGGWVIVQCTPKKDKGDGDPGFYINLRADADEESDIALHFNPRINEGCAVRNSYCGGWQEEEREQPGFPFEKKDTVEIGIYVRSDKFLIYVNGEYYVDFNHRMPIEAVQYLHLDGHADFFESEFY